MMAKLKRGFTREIRSVPCRMEDGVMVECTVVSPPSSSGRKVIVWIEPDQVAPLLLELRDYSVRVRRTPRKEGVRR